VNENAFYHPKLRKFTPVTIVKKCEIKLFDSRAPYGAVNEARLHAYGRLHKFMLLRQHSPRSDALQWVLRGEVGTDFGSQVGISLDALELEFTAQTSGEMEVY
jgi:hypothetical protein